MNIAIIGYGQMGKMIEEFAKKRGHNIIKIFDPELNTPLSKRELDQVDVALEFTSPETATNNYSTCFDAGVPVVSGTTGWLDDWNGVYDEVIAKQAAFFYASNFSLGVNILFSINRILADNMKDLTEYRPNIIEVHHVRKQDAPSGTALSLAEDILKYNQSLSGWILNNQGSGVDLPVFAIREGNVPGTHEINYVSEIDKITIRHEAFNRNGFVLGALRAAEFIVGKKGVYSMKDLLSE